VETDKSSGAGQHLVEQNVAALKNKRIYLGLAIVLLLSTNSIGTLLNKYCNRQKIPRSEDAEPSSFVAPWFQTFLMFIGQSGCLLIYFPDLWLSRRRGKEPTFNFPTSVEYFKLPPSPFYVWFFPACLDLIAATLENYALVFTDASVTTLLANFRICVTCVLSLLLLKVALRWYHYFGVAVSTSGLILTGISAFQSSGSSNLAYGPAWVWLGIVFILSGTVIHCFQFVYEESLYRKYQCSPVLAVGLEGVCGLLCMSVLLPIFEATGVEKTSETSYQANHHGGLLTCLIVSVFNTLIKNIAAQTTSKLGSALLRAVWTNVGRLMVWVIDVAILQWTAFTVTALMGFIIVIFGILFYHNWMCPCWPAWNKFMKTPLICLCLKNPDDLEEDGLPKSRQSKEPQEEEHGISKE